MKKYFLILYVFFVFGIALIPLTPIMAAEPQVAVVLETAPDQQQVEPVESTTAARVQKAEYVLPFPGMLPDHPLYALKRIRDTILEKLISDPIRKSEFYILQSDKRLQMGIVLVDSGKGTLGETTVSKAEKYMEQAVRGLAAYKQNGGTVPPYVIEKLENATAKHEDVINGLISKANPTDVGGLRGSMTLLKELQGSLPSLKQ